MHVLVAYASESGSTRDVAQRIADVLSRNGNTVEALPVERVRDVQHYEAVVVGSAVHNMTWLDPALDLLRGHRDEFARRPVWLFSVGMPAALRRPIRRYAARKEAARLEAALSSFPRRGHRLFSGVYRKSAQQSVLGRVLFRAVSVGYGDFRDWREIESWGEEIARELAGANEGGAAP